LYYTTLFPNVKKNIAILFKMYYNNGVAFDKAALVGEPAVPC